MPAFGVVTVQSRSRREATKAVVSSASASSGTFAFATVTKVTDSRGIMPSQAIVEIRAKDLPRELFPNGVTMATGEPFGPTALKFFSRVRITAGRSELFVGNLVKRRDFGDQNTLVLEYWDDRVLLAKLPIRGAWVYDAYADEAKFIPRYIVRMNPFGYWNCTLAKVSGAPWKVPLFTTLAQRASGKGKNGESVFGEESEVGECIPWTQEHAARYVWWSATAPKPTYYKGNYKRLDSSRLHWPGNQVSFTDPDMWRAMPDTTLHAKSHLRALCEILEQKGSHDVALIPEGGNAQRNTLIFVGRTAATGVHKRIDLQTAGRASDIRTAFSFTTELDASDLATSVLVEGSTPKIESEFLYVQGSSTNTIRPSWTDNEYSDWRKIIRGDGGDGTHATVLSKRGQFGGARVVMDGTNGNPKVEKNSSESVKLAWQHYPNVIRYWQLVSDPGDSGFSTIEQVLKGVGSVFTGAPFLFMPRAPLPDQLQHWFESGNDQRGLIQLPWRIQLDEDGTGTNYHEITSNAGLRIRADGIFVFDGLVEVIAGPDANDLLYRSTFDIFDPPATVQLKAMKLNIALQHDTRIQGVAELTDTFLDPAVLGENGLQHYVFNPESYREWHQVGSRPAANSSFPKITEAGSDPVPLTRLLHRESSQASSHAAGRLKDKGRLKGAETWSLIGIRPDYRSGDFITGVNLVGEKQALSAVAGIEQGARAERDAAWAELDPEDSIETMQEAFTAYQGVWGSAIENAQGTFSEAFNQMNAAIQGLFDAFNAALGGAGTVADGLAAASTLNNNVNGALSQAAERVGGLTGGGSSSGSGGGVEIGVNRPVARVVYDFEAQATHVVTGT
ncbi:MAG: hypothetical protein HS116_18570 [Planctomycetes bacterium]|nr:hypothetical protein [Planctomycetota bacterium]